MTGRGCVGQSVVFWWKADGLLSVVYEIMPQVPSGGRYDIKTSVIEHFQLGRSWQ